MPAKNGGSGPRCVALVGPYGGGKTTLLESLLWITGGIQRKGSIQSGNTVGDSVSGLYGPFSLNSAGDP